ncbi:MAG: efflux RND transporter periplasmic adaptor subunit [Acidobacteria bacterium]|nr:efflux RND transporter periplasmic adaptor subunit [Acidobacteriota bacterium]
MRKLVDARRIPFMWPVVAALVAAGCGGSTSAEPRSDSRPGPPVPAVEVVQAREGSLPLVERLTGTARASGEVAIFPEASGRIVEVLVNNGAAVTKGQPLVRIQTAESKPQLDQARSQLTVAEAQVREAEAVLADLLRQLGRATTLAERGLVSRQEVDTQQSQVNAGRATVERAQAQVTAARAVVAGRSAVQRQSLVRAPISGRVGQRDAEVGMIVDGQTQLFIVGQLNRMRIEVPVAQDVLAQIRRGQRVEIVARAGDPPIVAEVSRVSPFLSPGAFSGEVEIDVPNAGSLVPGMFVTVDIHYGESEAATLVPTSAIYENPVTGETGVFVVSDPPAEVKVSMAGLGQDPIAVPFRRVDVLATGRQTVGVAGLSPGDWVVVVGQHLLTDSDSPEARVRALSWDHILNLQGLQREDLLRQFMEKQRQSSEAERD